MLEWCGVLLDYSKIDSEKPQTFDLKKTSIFMILDEHQLKLPYTFRYNGQINIKFSKDALTREMHEFGASIEGLKFWRGIPADELCNEFPVLKEITINWMAFDNINKSWKTKELIDKNQVAWDSTAKQKVNNFLSRLGHFADFVKKFHPFLFQYAMFFETDLVSQFFVFLNESAKKKGSTIRNHCLELKRLVIFEREGKLSKIDAVSRCDSVIG
jgi:hypothetical protein